jgi:hypothetical protein
VLCAMRAFTSWFPIRWTNRSLGALSSSARTVCSATSEAPKPLLQPSMMSPICAMKARSVLAPQPGTPPVRLCVVQSSTARFVISRACRYRRVLVCLKFVPSSLSAYWMSAMTPNANSAEVRSGAAPAEGGNGDPGEAEDGGGKGRGYGREEGAERRSGGGEERRDLERNTKRRKKRREMKGKGKRRVTLTLARHPSYNQRFFRRHRFWAFVGSGYNRRPTRIAQKMVRAQHSGDCGEKRTCVLTEGAWLWQFGDILHFQQLLTPCDPGCVLRRCLFPRPRVGSGPSDRGSMSG